DDDCDGAIDEGVTTTFYRDADSDGYGNASITTQGCSAPSGYVANSTDCNDANNAVHPGATDVCNGTDDDCDGSIDEDATFSTWYADADGDGYGNAFSSVNDCAQPTGYVANSTDCNDANAQVHPGAADICNGIDDNCDGTTDENALVATVTPSGTVTYCRTVPVTLSANTGAGITYQWYKGATLQPGATNSTFTTTKRGSFKVVETSGSCNSTSAYTTVARLAIPQAAITVYGNTDICSSGSVVMRANNAGSFNSTHTYQWNKGGLQIFGQTNRLFTATSTGDYTVTVTNDNGCSTTSAPVTVTSSCKGTETDLFSPVVNLFPNPSNGQFIVNMQFADDMSGEADIQIFNMLGQSVFLNRVAIVNGELFYQVNFDSKVAAGRYFVQVIVGDKVYTGQIVYLK
ncbi:MAG TPA: MopE-related protein, partial [Chitinophagales bacterium]|nr:MopE-related protein [Chitinophagales bacterium]